MFKTIAIALGLLVTTAVLPSHAQSFNGPITWSSQDGGNAGVYDVINMDSARNGGLVTGRNVGTVRSPGVGSFADGYSAAKIRGHASQSTGR